MYTKENDKSGDMLALLRHIRKTHVFLGGRDRGKNNEYFIELWRSVYGKG
jgi:hypothetical protein